MTKIPSDGNDAILARTATKTIKRRNIINRGLRYYHYRNRIAYSQARPTQITLPRETTRLDCSGLVACCMDFAEVMPKVDWRYTNTWIQDDLGTRVTLANARPGDVVFYGPRLGNPTHEALYLGTLADLKTLKVTIAPEVEKAMKGGGRMVLSNGHHPMGLYPIDYRSDRVEIRRFV